MRSSSIMLFTVENHKTIECDLRADFPRTLKINVSYITLLSSQRVLVNNLLVFIGQISRLFEFFPEAFDNI